MKRLFISLSIISVVFYTVWWVLLFFLSPEHNSVFNDYFADSYGIIALLGGISGIVVARRWDSLKSYVGKCLFFLSLGLIFQFLGQLSYTILFYMYKVENAYPSFGEVFYLLSIPSYVIGTWYISKASGISVSLRSYKVKFGAVLFPFFMILVSYMVFLRQYQSSGIPLSNIILDHIYPIGQAIFVSLAILSYYTTREILGGIMKNRVILILFSLLFQYVADSMFIFETRAGTWYAGGISDLMFVISYFLMFYGLIQFLDVDTILSTSTSNNKLEFKKEQTNAIS